MPHNFKEGINWVTDPTGATALASNFFAAQGGDDTSGAGTPLSPWKTFTKTLTGSSSGRCVLGSGIYIEAGMLFSSQDVVGDGQVILQNPGGGSVLSTSGSLQYPKYKNIVFYGWEKLWNTQSATGRQTTQYLEDCVIIGGNVPFRFNGNILAASFRLTNTIFINANVYTENPNGAFPVGEFSGCIFWNTPVNLYDDTNNLLISIHSSFLEAN